MTLGISPILQHLPGELEPITIIGLDCDDPSALDKVLNEEKKLLQRADIICGGKQILQTLEHNLELAGRLLPLTPPLEPLFECLASLRSQGMRVVVLADGDPLFYGIGASLAKRLAADAIKIQPAISCVQAACSRISLPWHNVFCLSLHGRDDLLPLFTAIANNQPVCVLTSERSGPDLLARLLLDRGADWFDVYVFEKMGNAKECLKKMTLLECAQTLFENCATVLLIPGNKPRYPILGLHRSKLHGGYGSERSVRGAILELLRIYPQNIIWDIGAASGLLALEACSVAHAGKIVAVEENAERALDIQENRRLLGAINLSIRLGRVPECLEDLPTPDRIIIEDIYPEGNVQYLLEHCAKILPPQGRLVASCHTLKCASIYRQFMEKLEWPIEMLQIQTSNIETSHFASQSPVFLFAAQKT